MIILQELEGHKKKFESKKNKFSDDSQTSPLKRKSTKKINELKSKKQIKTDKKPSKKCIEDPNARKDWLF